MHPDWTPVGVTAAEFNKDRQYLEDTGPLETKTEMVLGFIQLVRRLAASDTRRATLPIYGQVKYLTTRGNTDAKVFYDRMSPFFPGRPKAPAPTPPAPTP